MHSLNITRCIKFIKYRENKLIATKYVQSVRQRHASAFAIGQLCHQSATAPSRATHADHSARHVPTELIRPHPVDYATWSVIQFNAACRLNIQRVRYKSMKCDVSFTLGSVRRKYVI